MSSVLPTTDHAEIRRWADRHGARPAHVKGTGGAGDPGIIRLDFDEAEPDAGLENITWEEWFDKFEENGLALLHSDETRFNKLVKR
jgi:hypothetical protein